MWRKRICWRLPTHKVRLDADETALRKRIEDAYKQGGLTPPNMKDVIADVDKKQARQVVGVLVNQAFLAKIKRIFITTPEVLEDIKGRLVSYLEQNQKIAAPQFKELLGLEPQVYHPAFGVFRHNPAHHAPGR